MDLSDPAAKIRRKPADDLRKPEGAVGPHRVGEAPSIPEDRRRRKQRMPLLDDRVDLSAEGEEAEEEVEGEATPLDDRIYDEHGETPVDPRGTRLDELG